MNVYAIAILSFIIYITIIGGNSYLTVEEISNYLIGSKFKINQ